MQPIMYCLLGNVFKLFMEERREKTDISLVVKFSDYLKTNTKLFTSLIYIGCQKFTKVRVLNLHF